MTVYIRKDKFWRILSQSMRISHTVPTALNHTSVWIDYHCDSCVSIVLLHPTTPVPDNFSAFPNIVYFKWTPFILEIRLNCQLDKCSNNETNGGFKFVFGY